MSKIVTLNYTIWNSQIKESLDGVDEIVFKGKYILAYSDLFQQISHGIVTPIRLRFCFSSDIARQLWRFYYNILDVYVSSKTSVLIYDFSEFPCISELSKLYDNMCSYLTRSTVYMPIKPLVYVITGISPILPFTNNLVDAQNSRRVKWILLAIRSARTRAGMASPLHTLPLELCKLLAGYLI